MMLAKFLKKQATVAEVDQLIAQHQQEMAALWQKKADGETRIADARSSGQNSGLTLDHTGVMGEISASNLESERLQAERVAAKEYEISASNLESERLRAERVAAEEREFIAHYQHESAELQAALTEANKWRSEQKILEEQLADIRGKHEAATVQLRNMDNTIIQLRQTASEKGYTLPDQA
jgi:hypothetical protein